MKESKTDIARRNKIKEYIAGKEIKHSMNSKGEYELYSPDGISLYHYDYLILKKSDLKVNGKPILYYNVHRYIPCNEYGNFSTQRMEKVREKIQDCRESGELENYEIFLVGSDKDMSKIDLTGYVQEFTQTIYNMTYRTQKYYLYWAVRRYKMKWPEYFIKSFKKAVAVLKHLGLDTGISSSCTSLKSLEKEPRWKAVNGALRYWIKNGMKFSDEDDAYIKKAPRSIRGAYVALNGKEPVIKDINKEAGLTFLKIINPLTPISELPLYVGIENKEIKDILKDRMALGE